MTINNYGVETDQLSQNELYVTFDLGLAAALISADYKLVSLEKENRKKVKFMFKRENGIDITANAHWCNDLKITSRSFFENIKMLKNRVFSD